MKNSKDSIRKFVGKLNNEDEEGGYWLPNIQRPFVWREDQMERLFDSILREYPFGTLLVWKTKSTIRRRRFIDSYRKDVRLTSYYVPESEKPKMLVLDGQQRLQSLFIGLRGTYEGRVLCLDVLSGDRVAPEDIRYKFKFLSASDVAAPWVPVRDIVFSNAEFNQIAKQIKTRFDRVLTDDEGERIDTIVAKIVRIFTTEDNLVYQVVDSVDNPKLYTEDDVVEVFIRANSGGTPLNKSDLLFSLLTSSWQDAEDKMDDLLDKLNRTGYKFTRDFILKTCLSLFGKGAAYSVEKFREPSVRKSIEVKWQEVSAAVSDVRDFLYNRTFLRSDATLPSYLVLIPVIYARFHHKTWWRPEARLAAYLNRVLLTGAYSGSVDSIIDKATKKVDDLKSFDVDEMLGLLRTEGRSLEVTQETILNASYGSREIHLLFNRWYDFDYQPAYNNNKPQIDHIFPQSRLREVKVVNPNTGRRDMLRYYEADRNQIANCMLLTARENGAAAKADMLPEEWFAGKDEQYLDLHLIPKNPDLWVLDRFDEFIEARKSLIAKKFEDLLIR